MAEAVNLEESVLATSMTKSLISAMRTTAAVDLEESVVADALSTSEDVMDSFLSELSATLLDDLSSLIADNDSDFAADLGFDWDVVDL